MDWVRIGHTYPRPPALSNGLAEQLYAIDPYVQWDLEWRAAAVDFANGTTVPRCTIRVIHQFDDRWWAASSIDPGVYHSERVEDIVGIRPSPHVLPAELATEAGRQGEFRMGVSRYTVIRRSGKPVTVVSGATAWLPDSIHATDVVGLGKEHEEDYIAIGPTLAVQVSTPQTDETVRAVYERHYESIGSVARSRISDANRAARAYADDFPLSEWVQAWRAMWDRTYLGVSRYQRPQLDSIDVLARFAAREGHCFVPDGYTDMGWDVQLPVLAMLWSESLLSSEARQRLEALPGWPEAAEDAAASVIGSRSGALESYERGKQMRSIWLNRLTVTDRSPTAPPT